jgi:acylphosphatase
MQSRHSHSHDEPIASAHLDASVDADEGDVLLRVTGHVPAADFQPFVVAAARRLHVRGWVQGEAGGAMIRAIGTESQLVKLVRAILHEPPASASIRSLDTEAIDATTPPVGERFAALVADPVFLPETAMPAPALANVA